MGAARRLLRRLAGVPGARKLPQPALVAGRIAPRLRLTTRRPRLHRRLRPGRQGRPVSRSERRSGLRAGVVDRRQADRLHPHSLFAVRPRDPAAAPRGAALVDPHGRRRDGKDASGLPRRRGQRQRLPRGRLEGPAPVGRWRPHRLSVGEGRLDAPLRRLRRWRRRAGAAHARRVRGRGRDSYAGRQVDPLQLEPGRHRAAPRLAGRRRGRKADGGHVRRRIGVVAGPGRERRDRLHPLGSEEASDAGHPLGRRARNESSRRDRFPPSFPRRRSSFPRRSSSRPPTGCRSTRSSSVRRGSRRASGGPRSSSSTAAPSARCCPAGTTCTTTATRTA